LSWLNELENALEKGEEDSTIMLCYKNANRFNYNKLARTCLYGADAPRYSAGDLLIALSPLVRGTDVILANNQDVPIVGTPRLVRNRAVLGFENFTCDFWELDTNGETVFVIEEEFKKSYYSKLKALGKEIEAEVGAAKLTKSHIKEKNAKARWRAEYFPLKEFFADLDFRYALTIHKSQGSTFRNVYLHPDYSKGYSEKVSLFYVGVTRAAKRVNLVTRGAS
jgi:exodeoxyribonuclease-5